MTSKPQASTPAATPRSAARLAAVQALYSWELGGAGADALIEDFLNHGLGRKAFVPASDDSESEIETVLASPNAPLLTAILRGVISQRDSLDAMVEGSLSTDWPAERLEAVLRAILRAGAFELSAMPNTPVRVVISEYVDIAHAFYAGPEPKLVNAVLDRIARVIRTEELG